MSLYCAIGSVESDVFPRLQGLLAESLAKLGQRSRVLVVPPDQSRVLPARATGCKKFCSFSAPMLPITAH